MNVAVLLILIHGYCLWHERGSSGQSAHMASAPIGNPPFLQYADIQVDFLRLTNCATWLATHGLSSRIQRCIYLGRYIIDSGQCYGKTRCAGTSFLVYNTLSAETTWRGTVPATYSSANNYRNLNITDMHRERNTMSSLRRTSDQRLKRYGREHTWFN